MFKVENVQPLQKVFSDLLNIKSNQIEMLETDFSQFPAACKWFVNNNNKQKPENYMKIKETLTTLQLNIF